MHKNLAASSGFGGGGVGGGDDDDDDDDNDVWVMDNDDLRVLCIRLDRSA